MASKKIIVIEDDNQIRAMYALKLSMSGYTVFSAENGKIGLKICETELPDIILLDLRMPVMGGEKMLQLMREQAWGAGIRVIILTNISKAEAPIGLRFLSVDRYVVKAHSTPKEVTAIVAEVLNI